MTDDPHKSRMGQRVPEIESLEVLSARPLAHDGKGSAVDVNVRSED